MIELLLHFQLFVIKIKSYRLQVKQKNQSIFSFQNKSD